LKIELQNQKDEANNRITEINTLIDLLKENIEENK